MNHNIPTYESKSEAVLRKDPKETIQTKMVMQSDIIDMLETVIQELYVALGPVLKNDADVIDISNVDNVPPSGDSELSCRLDAHRLRIGQIINRIRELTDRVDL